MPLQDRQSGKVQRQRRLAPSEAIKGRGVRLNHVGQRPCRFIRPPGNLLKEFR
jgi:hypothetical protein